MADTLRDNAATTRAPALWRNPTVRGILYQLVLIACVLAIGAFLVSNTLDNLARQGIATGFNFLDRQAGFEIGEKLIGYNPTASYGHAFLVGLLNTLLVAAIGIVLATILGILIGIARLSPNWLVAKLAAVYVEGLRNVPVLLQLIVWWDLLRISAPPPKTAWQPLPHLFVSNRGIAIPVPHYDPVQPWIGAAFLLGIVASILLARWARRRQMATGRPFPVLPSVAALVIGLPLLVFIVGGARLSVELPALGRFNFIGGVIVSPEFAALVLGLSAYTAAFIAEIVRGGILGVKHGQTEAALALGLRRSQVLRLVILPQALRSILPPLTSQYLNLAKNSSLAIAIGFPDLTSIGYTIANQTGQAIESIAIIMAVYLVLSLAISLAMNWYNRRVTLVER